MNNNKYNDVTAILFAEAMNAMLNRSNIKYKQRLKYATNQWKDLYKTEVTKSMLAMYEKHDAPFEQMSTLTEQIGDELSKVCPSEYPLVIGLLRQFNEGAFKKELIEQYDKENSPN